MGMFDFLTPQRSAPTQQVGAAPATATAGPSNSAAQAQASGGGGGLGGWFRSAGSWVADKWDATTTAVSDLASRTGRVAKDMWEVAQSTDLSWKDGRLSVDTDLDEVMDLMPERVRSSLSLDREKSQNRVKLEFDRHTGAITASSDDLAIRSVNTERLKSGPVHLSGARITLSNPGGGIPGLDEGFSLPGYQDAADNLQASLSIDGVEAQDLEVQTARGPLRVAGLQTGGLRAGLSSEQGMPFSDKGSSSAGFSVEKALVRGVAGAGVAADELSVERAEAGISEGSESAFLETSGLAVKGGRQGGRSLGDASVAHARVDVQNRGGGAVFLDDAADHMVADVAVSTAGLRDFDGGAQKLGGASVAGLRGRWSQDAGTLEASADDLRASRLDTEGVDAGDVDLDGVKVELGPVDQGNRLDLRADAARVDDLAVDPASRSSGGPANLGSLAFSGGLGRLELNRARVGEGSLDKLNARTLSLSGGLDDKGLSLEGSAAELGADGLAWGREGAAHLGANGLRGRLGADGRAELGVASADARGLRSRYGTLGTGSLTEASATLGGGTVDARVASASLGQLDLLGRAHVDAARLGGLSASVGADRQRLGLASAHVEGARDRDTGVSLAKGDLASLSATRAGGRTEADLGHLGLEGLGWRDRVRLESASLDGVHATDANGRREARFHEAGMDGLTVTGVGDPSRIGHFYALDGALAMEGQGLSGRVAKAEARDLRHADLSAASMHAEKLGASVDGDTTALSADGVGIEDLSARNFSAHKLEASGAEARMAAGDMSATLASARAEQARVADRLSIELATAEDVTADVRGGRREVGIGAAHLADLRDRPTGTRVAEGDLRGFDLANDERGVRAGLDGLDLSGVSTRLGGASTQLGRIGAEKASVNLSDRGLDASLGRLVAADARVNAPLGASSAGASAGPSLVDTPSLVRSLGALVDDASLSATMPLHAGEIPGAPLSVREGTTASARVGVTDGVIDQGSRVGLSRGLDGPLWTGVNSLYVDDRQRLMADVSGWSDQNVGKMVNKNFGMQGDRLHDVATLTDAVAARLAFRQTPAADSFTPPVTDLLDLDGLRADARLGLRAGTIDAGSAGRLTLADGGRGANTLDAQITGRDRVVASFSDLLASAFDLNAGGTRVAGGRGELEGARVDADLSGADRRIDARLGEADLRDLTLQSSQITLPATGTTKRRGPNS